MKRGLIIGAFIIVAIIGMQTHPQPNAEACGGLFCQNVPVDQQAERIIFAVNNDGTISAYVQINYTGSAPDFSWVVPVPNTPEVDVAEVATFDELSTLTQPVFIPPDFPDCAMVVLEGEEEGDAGGDPNMNTGEVDVLASGSVGPYNYAVITSPDPDALIIWLRENEYRVTEEMEPLIHVYNDEGMVFLAMKLKGEAGAQDIQPVKMTYRSDRPMIPLRLTAVAAMPNMSIVTWIFAEKQAYTVNYAHPTINDKNIRIFSVGPIPGGDNGLSTVNISTNYVQLVDLTVNLYDGRAMITEYASPTNPLTDGVTDPLLQELVNNYGYLTRFFARISPEEMTVDPVFEFDGDLPEMSNIHDLTEFDPEVVYGCKNQLIQVEVDEDALP